ncbi:hypothetical protein PSTG_17795 [Puccinia striiformis f. sp. tritici PST-78]|uniref:Uncharacterized protein n=1 Tax=Puccinia striiformis f. sp. tritici PST-78 TaxID=1165861 RepID=A0A0L0UP84_9BASI|nr:hypothetical protein PSTG_17795 [Puccinia striiformis f. sp. tritici PST-78]
MGIFILLVDTTPHVANFSIKSTFDSGARYKFERENRLYEPIYQIASFDAMVPSDPPQCWGALVSPERLFKYGSPTPTCAMPTPNGNPPRRSIPQLWNYPFLNCGGLSSQPNALDQA